MPTKRKSERSARAERRYLSTMAEDSDHDAERSSDSDTPPSDAAEESAYDSSFVDDDPNDDSSVEGDSSGSLHRAVDQMNAHFSIYDDDDDCASDLGDIAAANNDDGKEDEMEEEQEEDEIMMEEEQAPSQPGPLRHVESITVINDAPCSSTTLLDQILGGSSALAAAPGPASALPPQAPAPSAPPAPSGSPEPPVAQQPSQPPAATPKKKGGRPKGSKNKPKAQAALPVAEPAASGDNGDAAPAEGSSTGSTSAPPGPVPKAAAAKKKKKGNAVWYEHAFEGDWVNPRTGNTAKVPLFRILDEITDETLEKRKGTEVDMSVTIVLSGQVMPVPLLSSCPSPSMIP